VGTLQTITPRRYLARDFDGYRAEIFEHARTFFNTKIKDLSESGLGGLMIDACAMIGDSLSFYLDHQFSELDPETAVEPKNLQKLARAAGIKMSGASPARVDEQRFFIKVPAVRDADTWKPDSTLLPIIKAGAVVSDGSVDFTLVEDIDMTVTGSDGALLASVKVLEKASDGSPKSFAVSQIGSCLSGNESEETFSIGSTFVPFRQITLSKQDVTSINSVTDSAGNVYYEVGALTHDTVYRAIDNAAFSTNGVKFTIKPTPAPYRFTTQYDPVTRLTTLVFGGGDAAALENDAVPDPTTFAIPFKGRRVYDRISVTPEKLLRTKTLGVAATNVSLTVSYRAGGGLSHNVSAGKISNVKAARLLFPFSSSTALTAAVKSTLATSNDSKASDGEDPMTLDNIRAIIPAARAAQDRIVTREDLIARVYSMPSEFGRVFRIGVNNDNLLSSAAQMFVVSRDENGKLTQSRDALKRNLVTWLNPHRLIADTIDIRDAQIVNLFVQFEISVSAGLSKATVVNKAAAALSTALSIDNIVIDQPISIDLLKSILFSVNGVASISSLTITSLSGIIGGRLYPGVLFDVQSQTRRGVIIPPPGGIFELRYPDFDIVGKAT